MQTSNPYVGPRPFQQGETHLFFGRDREVSDLRALVVAHPAVLLYAESGAGKSSLVNARLRKELAEREFEVLRPGRVRGAELDDASKGADNGNVYTTNLIQSLDNSVDSRASIVDFFKSQDQQKQNRYQVPKPFLLIVDQFEELFTAYPGRWKEREAFLQELASIARGTYSRWDVPTGEQPQRPVRLLLVMREEYLAQMDAYADLFPHQLQARYRLECLRRRAALEAVMGPARTEGKRYACIVVRKLVRELLKVRRMTVSGDPLESKGEYVAPVQLQVVCRALWERHGGKPEDISVNDLDVLEGVDRALQEYYEKCLEETHAETQVSRRKLRDFFAYKLIMPPGIRRPEFVEEGKTASVLPEALEKLKDRHLIRGEMRPGGVLYELIHDRFIGPILESQQVFERYLLLRKLSTYTAVLVALLILAWFGTWKTAEHFRIVRAQEEERAALSVLFEKSTDPLAAYVAARENPMVQRRVMERVQRMVNGDDAQVAESRAIGARLASVINPAEFWRSVDGGFLWQHGEWLELCRLDWTRFDDFVRLLELNAKDGSPRQKYVAFCLVGQRLEQARKAASPGTPLEIPPKCLETFRALCEQIVTKEKMSGIDPGVFSAAYWAARQLERPISVERSATPDGRIFHDKHSGMIFVRIPPSPPEEPFKPGSLLTEADRWPNEKQPPNGVPIRPVWVTLTEVTHSQMQEFLRVEAPGNGAEEEEWKALQNGGPSGAVENVSPRTARRYCRWLTGDTRDRRYRLPTEPEWEWAARGGKSDQAFCYGNASEYFFLFAADYPREQRVFLGQTRMPNFYGLFDTHGNVWEICDFPYEKDYDVLINRLLSFPQSADLPDEELGESMLFPRRGGAAMNQPRHCRCAQRERIGLGERATNIGFRIVLEFLED